jgi:hypothetical protein
MPRPACRALPSQAIPRPATSNLATPAGPCLAGTGRTGTRQVAPCHDCPAKPDRNLTCPAPPASPAKPSPDQPVRANPCLACRAQPSKPPRARPRLAVPASPGLSPTNRTNPCHACPAKSRHALPGQLAPDQSKPCLPSPTFPDKPTPPGHACLAVSHHAQLHRANRAQTCLPCQN